MPILELFDTLGIPLSVDDVKRSCTEVRVVGNNPPAYYYLHMPFTHTLRYHYRGGEEYVEPEDDVWEFLNESRIILGTLERDISNSVGSRDFRILSRILEMAPDEYLDNIGVKQTENSMRLISRALNRRRLNYRNYIVEA